MLKSLDLLADKLTGSDKILQRSIATSTSGSGNTLIGGGSAPYQKKDTLPSATILTANGLQTFTKMAMIQQTTSMATAAIPAAAVPPIVPIVTSPENIVINNSAPSTPALVLVNSNSNGGSTSLHPIENNNNNNISDSISLLTPDVENSSTNETNNNNQNTNTIINTNTNVNSTTNDVNSQFDYNKNDEYSKEQPDPDTIKMFAGQIPKSMDEGQLKRLFEEYGRVHTINVLRDKVTGLSRGCCFVTYYTRKAALRAQDALHNIKTLEGMHHPIQMKPADSENRNERKLFVGMLNKKYNEADVRQLFAGHGIIEECTVLRDQNGQSKGCAFVTFASKQAAAGAIKALDRSRTMEGCSAPLVVKFADTQKEKEQKKLQQIQTNLWGMPSGTTNGLTPVTHSGTAVAPTPLAVPTAAAIAAASPQILTAANPPQQASPYLATDAISPTSLQLFQQLQSVNLPQTFIQGLNTQPDHSAAMAAAGLFTPMSMHNLMAIASVNHPGAHMIQASPHAQSIAAQLTSAAPTLWSHTESLSPAAYAPAAAIPQLTNGAAFAAAAAAAAATASPLVATQTPHTLTSTATNVAGKQVEGPEGSNLFIYHLPPEFTDTDLASTFLPFGKVISAKIFIDKNTQKTKGFGFVSYDNPGSAYAAIKAMHGFPIGTRRLKVQLKRSKDAAKPY